MESLGLAFANDATMRLAHALRERPNVMSEAAGGLVSEMAGTPHHHYQLCSIVLEPGQSLRLNSSTRGSRQERVSTCC